MRLFCYNRFIMFDTKLYEDKLSLAINHFEEEIRKVRTGRAHPGQLDGIQVEVYGTMMPLNQVANITAPEAQMLLVSPFDPSNISVICDAIRSAQSLGFNPSDDGRVVRVPVPPLTEERRHYLVKQTAEKLEEARIAFRNIRQDAFKDIKHKKESKELSEDEAKRLEKAIDDFVAKSNSKIDEIFKSKEKEILTI